MIMRRSGVIQHNGKQWFYELSCGCDYCATFITTAITEATVFGNGKDCTMTVQHDNTKNTISVDCWS